jgi:hypothetical protein
MTAKAMSKMVLVLCTIAGSTLTAQGATQRFTVHGYLTQAFGIADRHQYNGLNRNGTADYRRAAILARFDADENDRFVVQLAHRRLGDSPTMQFEENVKLDMAFYEHRFAAGTNLRVGKMALPWGIYNEVRYAGTLTPFYRAPYVIYRDGTYTSETIDGASVSHVFRAGDPWEISVDAYGGSFDQVEFGGVFPASGSPVYAGAVLKSKNVLGTQLWLATPVTGLRVGLSGRRQADIGGLYDRPEGGATSKLWNASIDGNFDRFMIRAEHQQMTTFGFEMRAQYAQAGVRVLPWLVVNAQAEVRDEKLRYAPADPWFNVKAGRDNALGVNFHLTPTTVLKLEGHAASGYGLMYETIVNSADSPMSSAYFISSFSVAF